MDFLKIFLLANLILWIFVVLTVLIVNVISHFTPVLAGIVIIEVICFGFSLVAYCTPSDK